MVENEDCFLLSTTASRLWVGTSKRACERLMHAYRGGPTRMMAVRFGNVVGSAVSAIPFFRKQIAHDVPVSVAQPDLVQDKWLYPHTLRERFMTMDGRPQEILFEKEPGKKNISTAKEWEPDSNLRALDELFGLTYQYKTSKSYHALMKFISRFRFYSPFNAMLIHIQMAGANYVAPPRRWLNEFGRCIKPGGRPLVILQPMGPVMFVFDVSDTEPTQNARPLPPEVDRLFEVRNGHIRYELEKLIENAKRDGIRITKSAEGSQSAGSISRVDKNVMVSQKFLAGFDKNKEPIFANIPVLYDLILNRNLSREAQYATLVHELSHLYCGHLGTPNKKWWPDRRRLDLSTEEFEAESIAYLICSRAGIDNPSERYLSNYVEKNFELPPISLEYVLKVAGLIETMSREQMKLRKKS